MKHVCALQSHEKLIDMLSSFEGHANKAKDLNSDVHKD